MDRRHYDDPDCRLHRVEAIEHGYPIEALHHDIKQDDVRTVFRSSHQGVRAVQRCVHGIAFSREVVRDQLDDLGIIVDDQDSPLVSNGHPFSQRWAAAASMARTASRSSSMPNGFLRSAGRSVAMKSHYSGRVAEPAKKFSARACGIFRPSALLKGDGEPALGVGQGARGRFVVSLLLRSSRSSSVSWTE